MGEIARCLIKGNHWNVREICECRPSRALGVRSFVSLAAAYCIKPVSSLLYREMPARDGTRPPRKLPDPALMVPRPGTAAAALQKRRFRSSKD